jgi:hypothetical protein
MVVHWLRYKGEGWRSSIAINAIGATATATVAAIIGITKFGDGAWISMALMGALATVFWAMHAHYRAVEHRLRVPNAPLLSTHREDAPQLVVVPVEGLDRPTVHAVDYARTLSDGVIAMYVTDDAEDARPLQQRWHAALLEVPLVVIRSPYRSFVAPVMAYLDAVSPPDGGGFITVVLPEYRARWPWQRALHNQTARRLRKALLERPFTAVAHVPYRSR